jgi:hypothetical protein
MFWQYQTIPSLIGIVLFGTGKYCLVLVSNIKVLTGIARYCQVLPKFTPVEGKSIIHIVLLNYFYLV